MGDKVKVMVLATFHFAPPGLDLSNCLGVNEMDKSDEVEELVQAVHRFNPTKICVERPRKDEKEINEAYMHYLKGEKSENLNCKNEVWRVAFRLAQMGNHKRVYPIDVPMGIPLEEVINYSKDNDKEVYDSIVRDSEEFKRVDTEMVTSKRIIDYFRYLNSPENYNKDHSEYLLFSRVGAGSNYYGAAMLSEWYKRNSYVFSNLLAAAQPGDRIVVLYGAGHKKILSEFVQDYREFELVDALEYL